MKTYRFSYNIPSENCFGQLSSVFLDVEASQLNNGNISISFPDLPASGLLFPIDRYKLIEDIRAIAKLHFEKQKVREVLTSNQLAEQYFE